MSMKRVIIAALAIAAMVGCTKESDSISDMEGDVAAVFTSAAIDTRLSEDGTKWSASESIGITMVDILSNTETIASNGDNVQYQSTNTEEATSVSFEVAAGATALLYPLSGSVKFYAYYPYEASVADYIYAADISDQSKNIDFMTAATGETDKSTPSVNFNFSHRFSLLTLEITPNDDISSLDGVEVTISGISTTANYDIRTGEQDPSSTLGGSSAVVTFNTKEYLQESIGSYVITTESQVDKVVATIIMLPETLAGDASLTFTLGATTYTTSIPKATTFTAGKNHTYNIALGFDLPSYLSGSQIGEWGTADSESTLLPEEVVR